MVHWPYGGHLKKSCTQYFKYSSIAVIICFNLPFQVTLRVEKPEQTKRRKIVPLINTALWITQSNSWNSLPHFFEGSFAPQDRLSRWTQSYDSNIKSTSNTIIVRLISYTICPKCNNGTNVSTLALQRLFLNCANYYAT